ncbi:MAG: DNA topoisomerase VI subunit B [Candidatus Micrarchaeaceae archaeon]
MAEHVKSEEIFKEFKEHSISEFFRKNSQMLGYSGKTRSMTTIVHEYITNSLDACEEAGILPEIDVIIKLIDEGKYSITVRDNGPGIPSKLVGKVFATVLAGTKFHRYVQQRGQQGIGASGCTLFSKITTGKPITIRSSNEKEAYECNVDLEIKTNKPLITNMKELNGMSRGTEVFGEFGDLKYEKSDHGVEEYIKRTVLSNPHASIKLIDPEGKEVVFLRSINEMPKKPKEVKPHPLGIDTNDLIEFAHRSKEKTLSNFLIESFSRVTQGKIAEIKALSPDIFFDIEPTKLQWVDAEKLVKTFKQIKWMAPELDSLSTIGERQIGVAIKNILNPKFQSVVERKPKVFRGGIPFVVEAGIAYGGESGKKINDVDKNGNPIEAEGSVLRFANKVPLLFDGSNCAITEAVKGIQWKRYGIGKFEEEPVSVLINVSSVYVPYSGVGKQAIAKEDDIIEEIKLAVMDCGRILQRYLSGVRKMELQETRYKTIMRYIKQLSNDLSEITNVNNKDIETSLKTLIEKRYNKLFDDDSDKNMSEEKYNEEKNEESD